MLQASIVDPAKVVRAALQGAASVAGLLVTTAFPAIRSISRGRSEERIDGPLCHVKQVGRELAVGYVLEGTVRKIGQRVRITTQLIDAVSGSHIGADRYSTSTGLRVLRQERVFRRRRLAWLNVQSGAPVRHQRRANPTIEA
jgi:hypothetical protein